MSLTERINKIRCVIFDIDGVFTDGRVYYTDEGTEMKAFHTQDGIGIKLLQKAGITVVALSGRRSKATEKRLKELQVSHIYLGIGKKIDVYNAVRTELKLSDDAIAVVGDDLPELKMMQQAGLSIAVANAQDVVKQQANWTTKNAGGHAAVREICNRLLLEQGQSKDATA